MLGRLVLAVAGAAATVFSLLVVMSNSGFSFASEGPQSRALALVAGLAPIVCGVWTSWGHPGARRSAALLLLVGVGWFVPLWADPSVGSDIAFTIGLLGGAVCPALVAHLLFAYPSGRLSTTVDRVVVAAGYAGAVGILGVGTTVLYQPAAAGCTDCPSNLGMVSNQPGALERVSTEGIRVVFEWATAATALALWRLLRRSPAQRRTAAPVALPALVFLASTALTFAWSTGQAHLSQNAQLRRVWEVQAMALVALAAGAAWAPLSARRRSRELARLVVDLHRVREAGGMARMLGRLLKVEDLEIWYPAGDGRYIYVDGHPVVVERDEQREVTSLRHGGREVAVVVHRRGALGDPRLTNEIASAAYLGLDNERLRAETQRQLAEIRASRGRIVAAGYEERRRLERDLHDGAQQRVVGLALALRLLHGLTDDSTRSVLADAEEHVHSALAELRDLARGIYPVILSEEGLTAALYALSESTALWVRDSPEGRLPAEIETVAYQVVATAAASGPAAVSVTRSETRLSVDLSLLDPTSVQQRMADDVDALGGQLTIETGADGAHLLVRLPLEHPTFERDPTDEPI
jgi:signal transduction histidine kinase